MKYFRIFRSLVLKPREIAFKKGEQFAKGPCFYRIDRSNAMIGKADFGFVIGKGLGRD